MSDNTNTPTVKIKNSFRPDIQALRAVAVVSVLIFHVKGSFLPGGFVGVDIFFVISGYLITGNLIREIQRTGGIRWGEFWKRRSLRLLPAATVVLIVVGIALLAIGSPRDWIRNFNDLIASLFYFQNWNLASRATDYFANTTSPSPVQHFWSLAAEEQFYIIWPITIIFTLSFLKIITNQRVQSKTFVLFLVLSVITLSSFAYSLSSVHFGFDAYFNTFARMWEFGIGALIVFIPAGWSSRHFNALRIPRLVAGLLGATLIILSFNVIDQNTTMPGFAALLPVLGASLLLWAGQDGGLHVFNPLLALSPVQWVGNISYSLYLWHWPIIIFYLTFDPIIGSKSALLIVAISLLIAQISYLFIESPFRRPRIISAKPSIVLSIFVATSLATASFFGGTIFLLDSQNRNTAELEQLASECFGANLISEQIPKASCVKHLESGLGQIVPSISNLNNSGVVSDCWIPQKGPLNYCRQGEVGAAKKIALYGDSHASMISPSISKLAKNKGIELDLFTGWDCRATFNPQSVCTAKEAILNRLTSGEYSLVILINARAYNNYSGENPQLPVIKFLNTIKKSGTPIVVIEDGPVVPEDSFRCLDRIRGVEGVHITCSVNYEEGVLRYPDLLADSAKNMGIPVTELRNVLCDSVECPLVIGETLVYLDPQGSHFTKVFSESLYNYFDSSLNHLLPQG